MKTTYRYVKQCLFGILFTFLCFAAIWMCPEKAYAQTPAGTLSDIVQTKDSDSSFSFTYSYSGLESNVRFEVRLSTDGVNFNTWENASVSGGSGYVYNLPNAGSSYYMKLVPYTHDYSLGDSYGTESAAVELVTEPNAKINTIKQTAAKTNSITLKWDAIQGATGYAVTYYPSSSSADKGKMKKVTKNSVTLTKLAKNEEYSVKISPYRASSSGYMAEYELYSYENYLPVLPSKPAAPTVDYFWRNISKLSVYTKKQNCADGYQYEFYTASSKTDKKLLSYTETSSTTTAFVEHKDFIKYKFIKVRVRGYATVSGKKKYGAWSGWTYVSPQPEVSLKSVKGGLKLNWDAVAGASKYHVYVSTKQKSGYKKYTTTTKTSLTLTKCGSSKLKKGTTYYVYVEPVKKAGKTTVSGLPSATYCYYLKY